MNSAVLLPAPVWGSFAGVVAGAVGADAVTGAGSVVIVPDVEGALVEVDEVEVIVAGEFSIVDTLEVASLPASLPYAHLAPLNTPKSKPPTTTMPATVNNMPPVFDMPLVVAGYSPDVSTDPVRLFQKLCAIVVYKPLSNVCTNYTTTESKKQARSPCLHHLGALQLLFQVLRLLVLPLSCLCRRC